MIDNRKFVIHVFGASVNGECIRISSRS